MRLHDVLGEQRAGVAGLQQALLPPLALRLSVLAGVLVVPDVVPQLPDLVQQVGAATEVLVLRHEPAHSRAWGQRPVYAERLSGSLPA